MRRWMEYDHDKLLLHGALVLQTKAVQGCFAV